MTPAPVRRRLLRTGLASTLPLLVVQARGRAMWEPVVKASGFTPGD
jgi:hypothetical protein